MNDITITVDTRNLRRTLERFAEATGRDCRAVATAAMKSMIKDVIAITPPGTTTSESPSVARKRGEARLEGDIRKIIKPSRVYVGRAGKATAAGQGQIKTFHQANRSQATGRVKGGSKAGSKRSWGNKVLAAAPADVARYIRSRKKLVGSLRSGWVPAARRFGVAVPGWVARHGGPGGVTVRMSGGGISIVAENAVTYARQIRDMERRVKWVVMSQEGKTRRQLAVILKKRGR
jgi:hypothetical protein